MRFQLILIYSSVLLLQSITALWKLKSPEREEAVYAITLADHNAAFSSTVYCVDSGPYGGVSTPNGLSRALCDACPMCIWKRRPGFSSELEWRRAVTDEMSRLEGVGVRSGKAGAEEEPRQQIVGTWIVEAGPSVMTSVSSLATLAPSLLGVSLDRLVVSEEGTRRFFVVSGKPTTVKRMLSAGFISATPMPPKLKVDPSLEMEAAAAEREATSTTTTTTSPTATPLMACRRGGDGPDCAEILPPRPPPQQQDHLPWHEYAVHAALSSSLPPSLQKIPRSPSSNILLLPPPPPLSPPSLRWHPSTSWNCDTPPPPTPTTPTTQQDHASPPPPPPPPGSSPAEPPPVVAPHRPMQWAADWLHSSLGRNSTRVVSHTSTSVTAVALNKVTAYAAALRLAEHGDVVWVGPHAHVTTSDRYASKLVQQWPPEGMYKDKPMLQFSPVSFGNYPPADPENSDESDDSEQDGITMGDYSSDSEQELVDWAVQQPGILHKMGIRGQSAVVAVADTALDIYSCFFEHSSYKKTVFKKKKGASSFLRNLDYSIYKSTTHRKLRQYVVGHQYAYEDEERGGLTFLSMGPKARIQNLSWGADSSSYKGRMQQIGRPMDEFCYKHQDFIVLAAAGNHGEDNPTLSVTSPASSKNVVGVGSHRNLGAERNSYRRMDVVSDFSSRGPSPDGRIKPDVCGPGGSVVTSLPSKHHDGWSCKVGRSEGTSLSTPVVAGVTVLVRQYFMEGYYPSGSKTDSGKSSPFVPMGALLKAVLVNSGRTLHEQRVFDEDKQQFGGVGGQLYEEGFFIKPSVLPTRSQGWGGVDVSTTLVTPLSPEGHALKVFGEWSKDCKACPKLENRESIEYTFQVKNAVKGKEGEAGRVPLKVTLVWYDYAAHNDARMVTINNLDLEVELPASSARKWLKQPLTLHPNGGDVPDKLNTVEHIEVGDPSVGTYTVRVKGTAVPMSPQPFALVISGPFDYDTVTEDAFKNVNNKSKKKNKKRRGGKHDI